MSVKRSEHDNKYDRQMRLWGGHGQKRLETAHILMLGSGPTASECLKNLVLPNVGEFTLVDDARTSEADLGNNFFVDPSGLGRPRAEVVKELLLEMNPEVKGHHRTQSAAEVMAEDGFLNSFSLVVASCLPPDQVAALGALCWAVQVPLIVLRAFGLIGHARLQLGEHTIVESHFDNDRFDLFVHPTQRAAFPALQAFLDEFDHDDEKLDEYEHSHIPYVAVLAREASKWVQQHGSLPTKFPEKQAFKASINAAARGDETNFNEAVQFAFRVYDKPELDPQTAAVLADAKAQDINQDSKPFWVICAALQRFIDAEGKGCLPCNNNIPDMNSTTKAYVRLKQIYATKTQADLEAVWAHAQAIVKEAGIADGVVTREETEYIMTNCRGLQVVRTRSIAQELAPVSFNKAEIEELLEDWFEPDPDADVPPPRNVHWYFALRTADEFYLKHGRYPGVAGHHEADAVEMKAMQQHMLKEMGLSLDVNSLCLQEVARCGAREIHNIAAFVGGVGAQIALKVLLQQYVPINNTLVFNGIHGSCQTLCM